jgi:hypothetical protein
MCPEMKTKFGPRSEAVPCTGQVSKQTSTKESMASVTKSKQSKRKGTGTEITLWPCGLPRRYMQNEQAADNPRTPSPDM